MLALAKRAAAGLARPTVWVDGAEVILRVSFAALATPRQA